MKTQFITTADGERIAYDITGQGPALMLLHVPSRDLARVLVSIRDLLRPGGLFYWGQYGGIQQEGDYDGDHYTPKRFFSFLTDEQVKDYTARYFEPLSFNSIDLENDEMHFQGMVLRNILV